MVLATYRTKLAEQLIKRFLPIYWASLFNAGYSVCLEWTLQICCRSWQQKIMQTGFVLRMTLVISLSASVALLIVVTSG